MTRTLSTSLLAALLFCACATDSAFQATPCTTDRDCAGGLCQGGLCTQNVTGGGDGGVDAATDGSGGADASDAGLDAIDGGDATGDGGGNDVRPDASADTPGENACGGTAQLEGQPGASCGPCDDGQWQCDGEDAVTCVGPSALNLCGGCGPLPALPGAPCGGCDGGQWVCSATDLVCDCDVSPPDGTCAHPFPIAVGDVETFSLCGQGDDEDPVQGPLDCRDVNVHGEDVVYELNLAEARQVRADLRDDDDSAAVDTVLYLRTDCADDASQQICRDDVPCNQSDVETGCSGEVQVRQSFFETRLEAGVYYLIADSFNYTQNATAFTCGNVRLEVSPGAP